MSDDGSSWAPFGPSGDDEPLPPATGEESQPDSPVSEPPPEEEPPAIIEPPPDSEPPPAQAPPPEPELPPAASFSPPVAPAASFSPPVAPASSQSPPPAAASLPPAPAAAWPPPAPPADAPAPGAEMPPIGNWPGPPPTPYGSRPRVPSNATASLVLGILGIVFCPVIASTAAIITGYNARQEIDGDPSLGGRGMTNWGIGLGFVGLAFGVLVILAIIGAAGGASP